jgi:hypothetical protein
VNAVESSGRKKLLCGFKVEKKRISHTREERVLSYGYRVRARKKEREIYNTTYVQLFFLLSLFPKRGDHVLGVFGIELHVVV